MASFFHGNPFSSPVGQRIERATDSGLSSEDWTLNIEICDIINETDEGPKDAIKAIRKRLSVGNKNFKSILLTLTVVETCVKNCGHRFHSLIAKKDFLDELTKIINPKNTPPQIVQDKILSLIQNWSDAFQGSPDLMAIVQTYDTLKSQGYEFPAQDLDTLAPIYTPQRSVRESELNPSSTTQRPVPTTQQPTAAPIITQPPTVVQQAGSFHPTQEQMAKLRTELDIVLGNVTVMSEMLTEMNPGQEESGDLKLLQELNRTCRAMQARLLELLEKVANEEVIGELLRINDDLNNVFIRYDRYERFRQAMLTQSQQATTATSVEPPQPPISAAPESLPQPAVPASQLPAPQPLQAAFSSLPATGDSLISFDEEASKDHPVSDAPTVQQTQPKMTAQPAVDEDEFDMFAQSRSSNMEESRKSGSTYSDNLQPFDRTISSAMSVTNTQADSTPKSDTQENQAPRQGSAQTGNQQEVAIDSIETWLQDTNLNETATTGASSNPQETMTSSEFDQFLAERAAAGGQRTGSVKGNSRPPQRQMQMVDSKAEEELFGL